MSLSNKVCKSLEKLWIEEKLCNFTIQIDDVSIKCHSIILGACSPFFLGLLQSEMKEANEGHVVLQNVSVSTFQLILKTLYTGEDMLSLDNFIEIWHAVHMLQIGFLVELCESFAAKNINIENFREIFFSAKLFDSISVQSSVKRFMLQNFTTIYETKLYLELACDEMFCLLSSNELHFDSEYPVLEMVLKWAEYKPHFNNSEETWNAPGNNKKIKSSTPVNVNSIHSDSKSNSSKNVSTERFDELDVLLSQVRVCVIRPCLLMNVLEHRLIKRNDKARQIIVSSLVKQMSFRHGQWPTEGIYRQFHEYGNYVVYFSYASRRFVIVDPCDGKKYTLKECVWLNRNTQMIVFDTEFYATGIQFFFQNKSNMFVYTKNSWSVVSAMPAVDVLLASNEQFIYVTCFVEGETHVFRLNPKCKTTNVEKFTTLPVNSGVTHVMSYQIYLVYFCTETVNGINETAVHMLDLQEKSWTKLDNLNGPAKNIISFRNDDNHFVLQTNGNMWVLRVTSENIRFNYVAKLWSLDHDLYGAVVYGYKLHIFYYNPERNTRDNFVCALDMFHSILYSEMSLACSTCIPVVLPKSCLS
ncbi:kelch repeat and BTB domain-containing protein 8-like [Physella acuta]|uniref:kelch repeat and BTB domain-containing protein 8-like n=1 Tax=Physella acuta TaxID=109671 RepID=UPI0027DC8326|nr:kelch repeat and BTB domain-containing protein 8-like [Physella acuta]